MMPCPPPHLRSTMLLMLLWPFGAGVSGLGAADRQAGSGKTGPAAAMRVLKANCLSCHNAEKRKGGLALHSREALLTGGENGPAAVEGKPEDSALIQSLAADADPHMPPKKQLSPEHVDLLREWVRDGFAWDEEALAGPASELRTVSLAALPAAYRPVMAMALSPDGSRLAAGCGNEVLLFGTGAAPTAHAPPPDQNSGTGKANGLKLLARAQAHPDAVQSMAWMPDGKTLVTGAFRRAVVWNVEKDTLAPQRDISSGLTDRVSFILALSAQPASPSPEAAAATSLEPLPAAAGAPVTAAPLALAALADGLAGEAGMVRILDTGSGQVVKSWTAHSDIIYAMALSRDGKRLATAGGDKLVKIWNPETGAETARLEAHTTQVLSVAFSPDDTQLITGGADRQLKVWDVATRGNLITLPVKDSAFNALQWITAGAAVFAAMDDGGLMKYTDFKVHTGAQSSESGKESRLGKMDSSLYCLTVSADGARLFAGSHDGRIFSWDKDGKLTETLNAIAAKPAPAADAPPATVSANAATPAASPVTTP